jgi:hypothetical protein
MQTIPSKYPRSQAHIRVLQRAKNATSYGQHNAHPYGYHTINPYGNHNVTSEYQNTQYDPYQSTQYDPYQSTQLSDQYPRQITRSQYTQPRTKTNQSTTYTTNSNAIIPAATTPANCSPVDSSMCVFSNTSNGLSFNLASSVFDGNFDAQTITQVKMLNNMDGSVTFNISYASSGNYPHYPSNPAYHNYITPYDLDSPIFKGMHYFNVTSF